MIDGQRVVLSQGEVRPGMVQGQYWREDYPRRDRYYATGPDGERVPLHVLGGWQPPATFGVTFAEASENLARFFDVVGARPSPQRRADPRLANRVER